MRTDKDEIARLKAENLELQARFFSEKPAPVVAPTVKQVQPADDGKLKRDIADAEAKIKKLSADNSSLNLLNVSLNKSLNEEKEKSLLLNEKIEQMKKTHEDEINRISLDLSEMAKERDFFAKKTDCINTLKIKNSELEGQVHALSERVSKAEAQIR